MAAFQTTNRTLRLNAIHLPDYGWYRVDARGNKPGMNTDFTPPLEQLAFPGHGEYECDLPGIRSAPLPAAIEVLSGFNTYQAVYDNLPDVDPAHLPVPLPWSEIWNET